jgi:hypothetical protein
VREKLGYSITSDSYIHFLLTSIFKTSIQENIVDIATVTLYFGALVISTWVNFLKKNSRN